MISLQHGQRLNLIGALAVTPAGRKMKLTIRSCCGSVDGEQIVLFLRQLLKLIRGEIMLLWDNHPIHNRKSVQQFLARHPRIHIEHFPTCAPELNPVEMLWNQIDEYTAGTAPRCFTELRKIVSDGVARSRASQHRLWACIFASFLPWP
jgi:DDE superfamily endonuclease